MTTEVRTHTPGPWNISKHATPHYCPQFGIYAEGAAAHRDLAIVKDENAEANAQLIAAAPELLEALRYYVDQHEQWRLEMPERNENDGKAWERTRKLALEAIAKATNSNAGQAQAYPAGRWTGGGK